MTAQMDLLSYIEAKELAEQGMARAVDHADRKDPGWSERAFEALLAFTVTTDGEFTAERARAACHESGLAQPPDARAWGAVFNKASKRGHIVRVGYAPRACGHNTPTIVWRAA